MATNAAPAASSSFQVLAPTGHFPDWLKAIFEETLKAKIEVQAWSQAGEAEAALAVPGARFDLALVADTSVARLIEGKALRPLPTASGVKPDHVYLGHYFDRENRFVWPYAWSLAEMACDGSKLKEMPQHWIDLGAPELARRTWFSDAVSVKALDQKARHWAELKHLAEAGPLGTAPAAEGEAAIRVASYAALRGMLAGQANWKYVLPEEGSLIFLYHLALPVSGVNPALADGAVALFMEVANTARLALEANLAVTQKEAVSLVPLAQAQDPLLYPPLAVMSRCSFAKA